MKFDINQAPFASTLMSSIKSTYEYYHKKEIDPVMLYGLSGHAFVVNITKGIGPCAPYWWRMLPLCDMCKKTLGVEIFVDEISVTMKSPDEKKIEVTNYLKNALDEGYIVFMSSLEFQLIIGYEDNRFILSTPWDDVPSVCQGIEFNTLNGMKDFMSVYKMIPSKLGNIEDGVKDSIKYAISLFEDPHTIPEYAMGIKAYDYWKDEMTDDTFNGHGNWWSATVWAESRYQASEYMKRIKKYFNDDELLDELSKKYRESSELFKAISNKEVSNKQTKIQWINELKKLELSICELLKKLPL